MTDERTEFEAWIQSPDCPIYPRDAEEVACTKAAYLAARRSQDARIAEIEAIVAALCEAVLTLNALEIKVELLARRNQVPSANLSKQLSDQWAEVVRLAKQDTPTKGQR